MATPVTGWLVARLGQRQLMMWAVVCFAVVPLLTFMKVRQDR